MKNYCVIPMLLVILISCNKFNKDISSYDLKKKELELKEKELVIKESEMTNTGYSKSKMTEYDYYEKLRLERENKEISQIKTFDLTSKQLNSIDYFDMAGYLIKREIYMYNPNNNESKLYSEFIITPYDKDLKIGVKELIYETESSPRELNYTSQLKLFLELETQTTVEDVKFIFNEKNQLTKKEFFYGDDLNYEVARVEEYFYDNEGLLNYIIKNQEHTEYKVSLFYDDSGLLMKQEVKFGENDVIEGGSYYEYEFLILNYSLSEEEYKNSTAPRVPYGEFPPPEKGLVYKNDKTVSVKQLNLGSYECQITNTCLLDYIEPNFEMYNGSYIFLNNGTDEYNINSNRNEQTITNVFESLTRKENVYFEKIRFDYNMVFAFGNNGEEFKGKFVKLNCDVNLEMKNGLIGLLVEDKIYVKQ